MALRLLKDKDLMKYCGVNKPNMFSVGHLQILTATQTLQTNFDFDFENERSLITKCLIFFTTLTKDVRYLLLAIDKLTNWGLFYLESEQESEERSQKMKIRILESPTLKQLHMLYISDDKRKGDTLNRIVDNFANKEIIRKFLT